MTQHAADADAAKAEGAKAVKHSAILEHAIHTFAELGYRGTDVQAIADGAGVGKGTVYRHFGNKEELFWATSFEVFVRLRHRLFEAVEQHRQTLEKIRAACRAYIDFYAENPDYLRILVLDRAEFDGRAPDSYHQQHDKLLDEFAAVLQEGIDAGEVRPIDAHRTTASLGSLLMGTVVMGCYIRRDYTMQDIGDHVVGVFLDGLRPDSAPRETTHTRPQPEGDDCNSTDAQANGGSQA